MALKDEIRSEIQRSEQQRGFGVSVVPLHTHNGIDSNKNSYPNLINRTRYVVYRVLSPATVTTVTGVGGALIMPFGGYFNNVFAYTDTAGTTGTMTVDVLLNGTTIFITDLVFASGATQSNTVANFTTTTFASGGILTFSIDQIQSTAAKGLTFYLKVTETTL